MKIKELLKKVLSGEELNALDKAELERFDPDALQKQLSDAQAKAAELERKQEEAEAAKLSESEKLVKRAEKAEADLAKANRALADAETAHNATRAELGALRRSNRVAKLAAESGCVDPDYLDFMATKGNIDLDKDDAVKSFLDDLKTKSPGSFKAPIKPGAGDPPPANQDPPPRTDARDRIGSIMQLVTAAPEAK